MHNELNKLLCNSLVQAAQDVFTSGFFCTGGKVAYLEGVISTWKGKVWAACSSQSDPHLHPAQLLLLGGIKAVPPTSWEGGNEVPRPLWAHPAPPARDGNSQGVGQGTAGVGLEPPARRGGELQERC